MQARRWPPCLESHARDELARIDGMGGAVEAIGYMKSQLVAANAARLGRIESGETVVVGVNRYVEAEPSPLTTGDGGIMTVDPALEAAQIASLQSWRAARDPAAVTAALDALRAAARDGTNIMPPSIAAAKAGVTTGEWGAVMREVFGEYRAPTGVGRAAATDRGDLDAVRVAVDAVTARLGRRIRFLVGKPGLDGHSNGAEQIAVRARDSGMEVIYEGIRCTPAQIVNTALQESVNVIGLSILSGSHLPLVREVLERMRAAGLDDVPLVVGGIIPEADAEALRSEGVARVYTPKDFELNRIMLEIVDLVDERGQAAA